MCLLIMSAMRVYCVILETNVLTTYKENVSRCLFFVFFRLDSTELLALLQKGQN